MMRTRHHLLVNNHGRRPPRGLLLLAVVFTILGGLALAALLFGCGRAQAQAAPPKLPIPPGAWTDCGPNGARHPINFASIDPATRWGLCAANPGDPRCSTVRDSGRDKRARCAREEYEIGAYVEGLEFKVYGCTPPPGSKFIQPDPLNVWDAAFAVDVLLNLQCERCNACGLTCVQCPGGGRPRPTPTPTVTATPQPTPTATTEPTPVLRPPACDLIEIKPTANPCTLELVYTPAKCQGEMPGFFHVDETRECRLITPPCEDCPKYERIEEPSWVRETIEAGLNALGRRWREKVELTKRWRREHPGPYYSPVTSGLLSQALESTEWRCYPVKGGEECLSADALDGEVPVFVPYGERAAMALRGGP